MSRSGSCPRLARMPVHRLPIPPADSFRTPARMLQAMDDARRLHRTRGAGDGVPKGTWRSDSVRAFPIGPTEGQMAPPVPRNAAAAADAAPPRSGFALRPLQTVHAHICAHYPVSPIIVATYPANSDRSGDVGPSGPSYTREAAHRRLNRGNPYAAPAREDAASAM